MNGQMDSGHLRWRKDGWADRQGFWTPGVGGWKGGRTEGQTGKWTHCPWGRGSRGGSAVDTEGGKTGAAWLLGGGSAVALSTDGWRGRRVPGRRARGRRVPLPAAHPRSPRGSAAGYGGVCSSPGVGMAVPGASAGSGAIPGAGRPRAGRPAPLHVTRRGGCERWGPAPLLSGTGTDPAPSRSAPLPPPPVSAAQPPSRGRHYRRCPRGRAAAWGAGPGP